MAMRPAYSPVAPLLGCRLMASKPVMAHSWSARCANISAYLWPHQCSVRAHTEHDDSLRRADAYIA